MGDRVLLNPLFSGPVSGFFSRRLQVSVLSLYTAMSTATVLIPGVNDQYAPMDLPKAPHALSADEVRRRLSNGPAGLTEAEAQARRAHFGRNILTEEKTRRIVIFLRQFNSIPDSILIIAAVISLGLRDGGYGALLSQAAFPVVEAITWVEYTGSHPEVRT